MAGKFMQIVYTLFYITIIMKFSAKAKSETTISDQNSPPECPYPCLPPPTATTNFPPPPPPPSPRVTPSPPSGSGYFPPPSGYYSPPTGYLPYYPPPTYPNDYKPPPPDPILPYFPFYYKHPLHGQGSSSATTLKRSAASILQLLFLVFVHKFM